MSAPNQNPRGKPNITLQRTIESTVKHNEKTIAQESNKPVPDVPDETRQEKVREEFVNQDVNTYVERNSSYEFQSTTSGRPRIGQISDELRSQVEGASGSSSNSGYDRRSDRRDHRRRDDGGRYNNRDRDRPRDDGGRYNNRDRDRPRGYDSQYRGSGGGSRDRPNDYRYPPRDRDRDNGRDRDRGRDTYSSGGPPPSSSYSGSSSSGASGYSRTYDDRPSYNEWSTTSRDLRKRALRELQSDRPSSSAAHPDAPPPNPDAPPSSSTSTPQSSTTTTQGPPKDLPRTDLQMNYSNEYYTNTNARGSSGNTNDYDRQYSRGSYNSRPRDSYYEGGSGSGSGSSRDNRYARPSYNDRPDDHYYPRSSTNNSYPHDHGHGRSHQHDDYHYDNHHTRQPYRGGEYPPQHAHSYHHPHDAPPPSSSSYHHNHNHMDVPPQHPSSTTSPPLVIESSRTCDMVCLYTKPNEIIKNLRKNMPANPKTGVLHIPTCLVQDMYTGPAPFAFVITPQVSLHENDEGKIVGVPPSSMRMLRNRAQLYQVGCDIAQRGGSLKFSTHKTWNDTTVYITGCPKHANDMGVTDAQQGHQEQEQETDTQTNTSTNTDDDGLGLMRIQVIANRACKELNCQLVVAYKDQEVTFPNA